MDRDRRVVAVGTGPRYDPLMIPILERLRAVGRSVDRYSDFQTLRDSGALEQTEVIISNVGPAWALRSAPKLSAIVNMVTGSEMIDVAVATQHGIVVGIGQSVENYESMAEGTFMLMLNALKDMPRIERTLRDGLPRGQQTARQLRGKTVGLIGYGRIAQGFARRLEGWGVRLLVSAPRLPAPLPTDARQVPLEEMLAHSDIVVVLCSLNEATRGLLDRDRLGLMKPDAVLVNTSRGAIIDETALFEAARDGRLGYIALDVFDPEPLAADSPLRSLPNAILTPHMAGHTIESEDSLYAMAADNVQRVLRGEPPIVVLNPEVLPRWRETVPRQPEGGLEP